jgi:hypothetical protein
VKSDASLKPERGLIEFDNVQNHLPALEAQVQGLQLLVADLLWKNQNLRQELAQLEWFSASTASATHPQPRQDHSTAG